MSGDRQKARYEGTVKIRESGGRSLEVTIPKPIVESMKLKNGDKLIVLEDKERGIIMYVNPKNNSINELDLYFPFSKQELEEMMKEYLKGE